MSFTCITLFTPLLNRLVNPSSQKQFTHLAILNISEVESRFYLYPFTCLAKNTYGIAETYITLIYPGKPLRIYFKCNFVLLW